MTALSSRAHSDQDCVVLLLDDHQDTREMYAEALVTEGAFEVECNVDPTSALEWVKAAQPDVVVTDYRMPGLDGLELCRQLAADPATCDIPRILVSGFTSEAYLSPFRPLCAAVLTKPVLPTTLIAEIRRVVPFQCGRPG
jgi:CheY-like chemotaxis protein